MTSIVNSDFYTTGSGYGLTVDPTIAGSYAPCQAAHITWRWDFTTSSDEAEAQQAAAATMSIYIVDAQSLASAAVSTDTSSTSTTLERRRRRRGASWRHDRIVQRQVAESDGLSTTSTSSAVQILLNGRTSVYLSDYTWEQVNVSPGEYVALLAINGAGSQGIAKSHTFTVVDGDVSCVKYGIAGEPSSISSSVLLPTTSTSSLSSILSTPSALPTVATTSQDLPPASTSAASDAAASSSPSSTSSHHSNGGGIAAGVIISLLALIALAFFLWQRKRKSAFTSDAIAAHDVAPSTNGSITPTEMKQQRETWDTFSSPDLDGAQPLSRISINEDAPAYTPADAESASPWLRVDPNAPAPGGLFNYHRNTHLSRISEVPSTMTANTSDIDLGYGRSDVIEEDDEQSESLRAMGTIGAALQRSDSTSSSTIGGVRRKPVPTLRTINTDDAYGDDVLASLAEDTARLPSSRPASASSMLLPPSQRNSARASSTLGDFEAPMPPSDDKSRMTPLNKSTWSVSTDGALSSAAHDSIISSTASQRDAEMSLAYNEAVERLERERKAEENAAPAARPSSVASASSVRTVRGVNSPDASPFDDSNAVDVGRAPTPPKRDSRERVLLPTAPEETSTEGTPSALPRAPTLSLYFPSGPEDSFSINF